jgi:hypothetical protein
MNNRDLATLFGSDDNQKMLFSILEESTVQLDDKDIMELIEEVYNSIIENILENTKSLSIMEINKLFIKHTTNKVNEYYNMNFYKNKNERKQEKRDEIQNRINMHVNNFESFQKKLPKKIDFTEKGWNENFGSVDEKINLKIKERESDLESIKENYQVLENEEDLIDHKKWIKNKTKVEIKKNNKKKNLKISTTPVNIDTIEIKESKRVRFKDEEPINESYIKRIETLEKEVIELKRLIKEIASEKLMTSEKIMTKETIID